MLVKFTTAEGELLYEASLDVVPGKDDVVLFPSGRVATVSWRTFALDQIRFGESHCVVTVGPVR